MKYEFGKIQVAKNEDLVAIEKLERHYFITPYRIDEINNYIEQKSSNYHIFLIKFEDEIIAYVIFASTANDTIEIYKILVISKFRNNGLATRLLKFVTSFLINGNKIDHCFIEVETSNNVAINFYKKNKFVAINERLNYYGPNRHCYTMYLIITN